MWLQDLQNCVDAAHECMLEHEGMDPPSIRHFQALRSGMVAIVLRKHCKEGLDDWEGFLKHCKIPHRVARGYNSIEAIDEAVLKWAAESETPHMMPTPQELVNASRCKTHPRWKDGMALSNAVSKYGMYAACLCMPSMLSLVLKCV